MQLLFAALLAQTTAAFGVSSPSAQQTSGVGNWKYCKSTADPAGKNVQPYDRVYTMMPVGSKPMEHATLPAGFSTDPTATASWTATLALSDLTDTMTARTFNDSLDSYNVGLTANLLKTWSDGIKKCGNTFSPYFTAEGGDGAYLDDYAIVPVEKMWQFGLFWKDARDMTQHYAVGEVRDVTLDGDIATFTFESVPTDPLMYPQRITHPSNPQHYHTYPAPDTIYSVPSDKDELTNWFFKFYHPWAIIVPEGESAEDVSSTNHEDVELTADWLSK